MSALAAAFSVPRGYPASFESLLREMERPAIRR
jgi:hypothetical protein